MNNKLLLNIVIAYFLMLCLVLIFQISRLKNNDPPQADTMQISESNRLDNATVICKNSPIILRGKQQLLLDSNDVSLVPEIKGEAMYVPANFFKTAFNATVDENGVNVTLRLDNRALVFENGRASVIDNSSERDVNTIYKPYLSRATTYIPLSAFAQAFDKYLYYYDGMIIITDTKDSFKLDENPEFISELRNLVTGLPLVDSSDNIDRIIASSPKINRPSEKGFASLLDNTDDLTMRSVGQRLYCVYNDGFLVADTLSKKILTKQKLEKGFIPYSINEINGKIAVCGSINSDSYKSSINMLNTTKSEAQTEDTTESRYFLDDPTLFSQKQALIYIYDASTYSHIKTIRVSGDLFDVSFSGNLMFMLSDMSLEDTRTSNGYSGPYYVDTSDGLGKVDVSLENVNYFPDSDISSFTSITVLDFSNDELKPNVTACLGAGENKLLSGSALYVAKSLNCSDDNAIKNEHTHIYKLNLSSNGINYSCDGIIRGYVPGKDCISNFNGYMRILTDHKNSNNENVNNIFVLNNNLEVSGSANEVAQNADIKSAIYTDNKVFLVPSNSSGLIYIVDMSDPLLPTGLGAAKFTEGNLLLYPYDSSHIITIDDEEGLCLSAYALNSETQPTLLYREELSEDNITSSLFKNSGKFHFDTEKNMFVLPVTIDEQNGYNGGYIYTIDMDDGFTRRGILKNGNIDNALKIGNTIFIQDSENLKYTDINSPGELKTIN